VTGAVRPGAPERPTYVFLAGIGNSEPEHWQSLWHRSLPGSLWVEHADWDRPDAAVWVADLDAALASVRGPKLLVAHSLGCLLAVEWARAHHDLDVKGSFLVAVPETTGPNFPRQATGFRPAASGKPPVPALVVASTTDRYASFESARAAAVAWGAAFEDVGPLGHINLASNLGDWPAGRALLEAFVARVM